MKAYYDSVKENAFEHLPLTFHIKGLDDPEFKKFIEYYNLRT